MNQSQPQQRNLQRSAPKGSRLNKKVQKPRQKSKAEDRPQGRKVQIFTKAQVNRTAKPIVRGDPVGDIIVSHREFIADVVGVGTAFTVRPFAINPGLPGVFPWLSSLARNFESYKFEKLEFRFETESPSTATGTAIIAVDYDASDANPTTKTQVMAYRGSVRSPIWSDSCHSSLKEDLSKRESYMVRSGDLAANQDVKLYDTGNLFVCTKDSSVATGIGELYVDYRVRLMTPQLGSVAVGDAIYGAFTGVTNAAPAAVKTGNLPATAVSTGTTTSSTTFTFTQPWEGYLSVLMVGTAITGVVSGNANAVEIKEVVDAGALNDIAVYRVTVNDPATLATVIIQISNTTLSDVSFLFGQADV